MASTQQLDLLAKGIRDVKPVPQAFFISESAGKGDLPHVEIDQPGGIVGMKRLTPAEAEKYFKDFVPVSNLPKTPVNQDLLQTRYAGIQPNESVFDWMNRTKPANFGPQQVFLQNPNTPSKDWVYLNGTLYDAKDAKRITDMTPEQLATTIANDQKVLGQRQTEIAAQTPAQAAGAAGTYVPPQPTKEELAAMQSTQPSTSQTSGRPLTNVIPNANGTYNVVDLAGNPIKENISSYPEALAYQNQISDGSTPTVSGRPDLYAAEPTAQEKAAGIQPVVPQTGMAPVTPTVATPEQLKQAAEGTLQTPAAEAASKNVLPPAANEPSTTPTATNTLQAMDEKGNVVYVEPGKYYKGVTQISTPTTQTPASGSSYIVKSGDTLSAIAAQFKTSVPDILAANPGIKNPNLIYKGQTIVIPGIGTIKTADQTAADLNKSAKGIADNLDKSTIDTLKSLFKDETTKKEVEKPSEKETTFKMPSSQDVYNSFVNAPEIKDLQSKVNDATKELNILKAEETAIENDIRSKVKGEAPESLIRAMTAEKARALYPKELVLQATISSAQTQLTQALENAKAQFQLKMQDQQNALTYLNTIVSSGMKLTPEQMTVSDNALGYGSGFTKNYIAAQTKATALKNEKDQLDLQSKIVDIQTKLPAGQSFTVGGLTYTSLSDPSKDIQTFSETDKSTGKMVIVEYNKKTKAVSVVNTGVTTKSAGSGSGDLTSSQRKSLSDYLGAIPDYANRDEALKDLNNYKTKIINDTGAQGYATVSSEIDRLFPPTQTSASTETASNQPTSPIEKDIARLKSGKILNDSDIRYALKNSYSKQEIDQSSIGTMTSKVSDTVGAIYKSFFK